jgi:hypothetical protein
MYGRIRGSKDSRIAPFVRERILFSPRDVYPFSLSKTQPIEKQAVFMKALYQKPWTMVGASQTIHPSP